MTLLPGPEPNDSGQAQPHRDIWAGYDPIKVLADLRASAGALVGVDRDELLADIRAQRGQASQGRPAD
jgi:hypothetical protein